MPPGAARHILEKSTREAETVTIVDPRIERYIQELRPSEDPILAELEALARERSFPAVGPQVGRLLYILCRGAGARRVLELGSGFGYSAWWIARALPPDGELLCSEMSAQNRDQALDFLERAGLRERVRYHVGDAMELLRPGRLEPGSLDLVFNDIDKEGYPDVVEPAVRLLRPGGLFVTDNTLWRGQVADPTTHTDETTVAVREFNERVAGRDELETVVLPVRDGVTLCVRR